MGIRILFLIVRLMAFTAAFPLLIFAFGACGPRITNQNVNVVNQQRVVLEKAGKGLSPKEVESILGQPARIEARKLALETQKKEVDVVRYFYEQDGQTITLHFYDNKLAEDMPRIDAPAPKPESK